LNYSFNVNVAIYLKNVNEAVFIQNIAFWILHNKANKTNFYDGYYWTYNTLDSFSEIFPFWTYDQIRTIIKNLEKKNILLTGSYNKKKYDKTKWYTLDNEFSKTYYPQIYLEPSKKVMWENPQMSKNNKSNQKSEFNRSNNVIWEFSQMDVVKFPNGYGNFTTPIPDINTDINTDVKTSSSEKNDDVSKNKTKIFPKKKKESISLSKQDIEYLNTYRANFKTKYKATLTKNYVEELFIKTGKENLEFYLENYQKFLDTATQEIKDISRFFNYIVTNKVPLPVSKLINNKPIQATNYEQREYDDDYFNSLYCNVEFLKTNEKG